MLLSIYATVAALPKDQQQCARDSDATNTCLIGSPSAQSANMLRCISKLQLRLISSLTQVQSRGPTCVLQLLGCSETRFSNRARSSARSALLSAQAETQMHVLSATLHTFISLAAHKYISAQLVSPSLVSFRRPG